MNFQQLRYVVEIERTGSISKAAKNLFMGQPNLSKAVKDLENEIRITIFKRTAHGVEPTPMGEQFLSYARTILSQMDELESLYKSDGQESLQMTVSVPRASYIASAFTSFLDRVPSDTALEVHFKETNAMTAISDVAGGESAFGIIRVQNAHEEYFSSYLKSLKLEFSTLWEFRMCLLMANNHPLAHASVIPYHALDGYPEIVHGDIQVPTISFSQINRDAVLKGKKKRIYVYDRGSQLSLLQNLSGSYMWVSPVPFDFLSEHGLVMKECPMADKMNKDFVIHRPRHLFTGAEQEFLDTVRRLTSQMVEA